MASTVHREDPSKREVNAVARVRVPGPDKASGELLAEPVHVMPAPYGDRAKETMTAFATPSAPLTDSNAILRLAADPFLLDHVLLPGSRFRCVRFPVVIRIWMLSLVTLFISSPSSLCSGRTQLPAMHSCVVHDGCFDRPRSIAPLFEPCLGDDEKVCPVRSAECLAGFLAARLLLPRYGSQIPIAPLVVIPAGTGAEQQHGLDGAGGFR